MANEQSENHQQKQGASGQQSNDRMTPPPPNTGGVPGRPIDEVGGAGLGAPPGAGNSPQGGHPPEKRAPDPQDRRNGKSVTCLACFARNHARHG